MKEERKVDIENKERTGQKEEDRMRLEKTKNQIYIISREQCGNGLKLFIV